ncbi:response regulator transcription factor [Pseudoxanthomonas sp. PXM01]|uniref:response regulator transcription factor n=1 Tax=Pseudoxanthomonas sp. PXM01 TaxID=2769295 RepID=UPI001786A898|nr:response regulator transcription factor [Pseudoxanthomonas sp. PXM01]MBD9469620.1 response regulator transcription factor [Pseudoxanthomonas sp. PXM01]
MDDPIRVLVIVDDAILREEVLTVLSQQQDLSTVVDTSAVTNASASLVTRQAHVAIVELNRLCMNDHALAQALHHQLPGTRIIALAPDVDGPEPPVSSAAGVSGCVLEGRLGHDLVAAIRSARPLASVASRVSAEEKTSSAVDARLTRREAEILQLVASGNSNKAIANQLELSEMTVKAHMRNILAKLSASDRTHAVTIAIKLGFIAI